MVRTLILLFAALSFFGCESATPIEERKMTVAPLALEFQPGDSVETLSITHNCSCPFSWLGTELESNGPSVLRSISGQEDNTEVQVLIDRSRIPADSTVIHRVLHITASGSYGEAKVNVTIHK